MYPVYGQRNEPWQSLKIGNTNSTMHDYGCTITCLAMVWTTVMPFFTPDRMLTQLEQWGALKEDLVWWSKVPHFSWRFYCREVVAPIEEIKQKFRDGKHVLLQVHLGTGNQFKPNHWVLMVSEDFTIHDPWFNDEVKLADRYSEPAKAILGGAYFDAIEPLPEFPKVVTVISSVRMRIRNAPNTQANVVDYYMPGREFTAIGRVAGETVDGNSNWYQINEQQYIWTGGCN